MRIQTHRLILRELTQNDFAALCSIMQDEQTMYAYNGAFTDAEVHAWLDKQLTRYETDGLGLLAVELKETGEVIGQCGLTMQPWNGRQVLEVGYLFRRDQWHKGYASEAAKGCMDYAFQTLHAPEVCSIIRDTNAASISVAKRNGMLAEETWVKHYRGEDMPHVRYAAHNPKM